MRETSPRSFYQTMIINWFKCAGPMVNVDLRNTILSLNQFWLRWGWRKVLIAFCSRFVWVFFLTVTLRPAIVEKESIIISSQICVFYSYDAISLRPLNYFHGFWTCAELSVIRWGWSQVLSFRKITTGLFVFNTCMEKRVYLLLKTTAFEFKTLWTLS